jgi:hypothetical protein
MRTAVTIGVVSILAAIAGLHLYWALGGTVAKSSAVPEIDGRRVFSPSRSGTIAVALALLFAAVVVAITGHLMASPVPVALIRLLAFGLAITMIARAVGDFRLVGFFKRVRGTRFARLDSYVYAPLCLGLGLAISYIACQAL